MKILIACEFSGIVREEFRKRGHDAWSCDLLPTEIKGKHYQGDIRNIIDDMWDMLIGFPPCTHLAVSGARWFLEKRLDGSQEKGIDLFMLLASTDISQIAIENPVGIMSTEWRKPDQYIQPWQFGHGETKKTCLWLKGLPLLRPTNIVEGRESRIHKMPPSKDRGKLRSITYKGFAEAMASQWNFP
ncbi:hypothetical protein LCGC14_1644260 [marine sediment metagenome]|uniref:DNA cytosine methyltransferase n=1 Tax=marine sediment metagenome TaxID=412755 RepID=A0A0F9HYP9_9ZZZZ|nr:DNA cytosine methyltransferase [Candidatus Scalindua sp.]